MHNIIIENKHGICLNNRCGRVEMQTEPNALLQATMSLSFRCGDLHKDFIEWWTWDGQQNH
jgi:hypothetical protein